VASLVRKWARESVRGMVVNRNRELGVYPRGVWQRVRKCLGINSLRIYGITECVSD